jgi:hypothetical protein
VKPSIGLVAWVSNWFGQLLSAIWVCDKYVMLAEATSDI